MREYRENGRRGKGNSYSVISGNRAYKVNYTPSHKRVPSYRRGFDGEPAARAYYF